jgi:hypothetical protein
MTATGCLFSTPHTFSSRQNPNASVLNLLADPIQHASNRTINFRHQLIMSLATTTTTALRHLARAPRSYLFTSQRALHTTAFLRLQDFSNPFSGPSPPRLPKEDQDIFEDLQRQSTGAFSSPRQPPQINQSPDSTPSEATSAQSTIEARAESLVNARKEDVAASTSQGFQDAYRREIEARGKGEELHPNVRRGAPPEFEGDVNPKTGEVGGPKNEPLRWGAEGEWSYNGRTTDF